MEEKVFSFVTLVADLSMIYDQLGVIDLDLQIIHPLSSGTNQHLHFLPVQFSNPKQILLLLLLSTWQLGSYHFILFTSSKIVSFSSLSKSVIPPNFLTLNPKRRFSALSPYHKKEEMERGGSANLFVQSHVPYRIPYNQSTNYMVSSYTYSRNLQFSFVANLSQSLSLLYFQLPSQVPLSFLLVICWE